MCRTGIPTPAAAPPAATEDYTGDEFDSLSEEDDTELDAAIAAAAEDDTDAYWDEVLAVQEGAEDDDTGSLSQEAGAEDTELAAEAGAGDGEYPPAGKGGPSGRPAASPPLLAMMRYS